MKINENWQKIIEGLSRLQYQINLLAGGQEVEELLKRITDAINGAIEAATDANNATLNANVAADAANHVVQTAIEKITVVEELLIKLEVQQDELEHIKSSLILVSEAAQEATTNANSATMNANQASQAANAAKENLTSAVTTKLNEADTAITNATTAATTATQAAESIEGWGTATAWNSTTSYFKNNVVTYNGSTWQAKADNTNSVPTITNANWIILAQRGVDGKGSVASVNGKLPDENGNVALDFGAGTVQKVNGKNPDEKGEVTLVADDLGTYSGDLLENNSVSMQKLTQEVIDAITEGGGGVGNSYFVPYPLVTTEESQKSWKLPVGSYDKLTDSLLVFHNAGVLGPAYWTVTGSPASGYTVTIPDNPIVAVADNNVLVMVLKNTPSDLPEDISGTRLTDASIGLSKLGHGIQDAINNAGSKIDIIPTLDSGRTDAALAASAGKDLKQGTTDVGNNLTTHTGTIAKTTQLGHIKPDGKTITVAADGTASAKQIEISNNPYQGGIDKAASAEVVMNINDRVIDLQMNKPRNIAYDEMTIYVANTGNDNNDGLSEANPVKTIAKAVTLIKPLGAMKRTIRLKEGDTFNETLDMRSIHGSTVNVYGRFAINPSSSENRATIKGIDLYDCSSSIDINYIDVKVKGTITNVNSNGAYITRCNKVYISDCSFNGMSNSGINISHSQASIFLVTIANVQGTVVNVGSGNCIVSNISGANPSADYAYYSNGAIITGNEGTVTAKTAQFKSFGGQIFF